MAPSKQHYLTASVIGGFGRRAGDDPLRKALVAVREKSRPGSFRLSSAEGVAYERGLYLLEDVSPEIENAIDDIWTQLEGPVPYAIAALGSSRASQDDLVAVALYVAALGARHPDYFQKVVARHVSKVGAERLPVGNEVQLLRIPAFRNGVAQVRALRWRVLDVPEDVPRLILNDAGFSVIREQGRRSGALFVPLAPRLGLLCYEDAKGRLLDRRLTQESSVDWLNVSTWADAPRAAFAFPDDADYLLGLSESAEMWTNRYGPYRWHYHSLLGDDEL